MGNENLKKLHLLVVDDENQIVQHLDKNLSSLCHTFKGCTSSITAHEYFLNNEIDIVICDIRMPHMNGIELCQRLREINDKTIIIMLSASNDATYLMDAINIGVNKFLSKPCRIKELIKILNEFANQITATKEAKIYNEFMQKKFEINSKDFDEIINYLEQYKDAINHTNLVRRIDENGTILHTNEKFRKTKNIEQNSLEGSTLVNHKKVMKKLDKKGSYETTNVFQSQDSTYLKTTYLPIFDVKKQLKEVLEISQDVSEIYHLNEEIYKTQEAIIFMLSTVIENRSKETALHVQRVAGYSEILAKKYGLPRNEIELLKMASPLHDIGKIAIPDNILNKPAKLDPEEFTIIKGHTTTGHSILKDSNNEVLTAGAIIAHEHHENWDGSGYPQKLKGEEIHIFSRITALADVFDALSHDRCYKKAWSLDRVLEYIKEQRGLKFEPKLVDIFLDNIDSLLDVYNKYNEAA